MAEPCLHGTFQNYTSGFAALPGETGDQLRVTRTALGSLSSLGFAIRARFNSPGVSALTRLAGWAAIGATFTMLSDLRLRIGVLGAGFTTIGGAASTPPVPGLSSGTDVWLRGSVTVATAVCSYDYSFDMVGDYDDVGWRALGVPVVGTNAGVSPVLGSSNTVVIGSDSTSNASLLGRVYAFAELDSGAKTIEINGLNWPADPASSFVAQSGHTVNVLRSGSPATALTPPGQCSTRNTRGCAMAAANPVTATVPFDLACTSEREC